MLHVPVASEITIRQRQVFQPGSGYIFQLQCSVSTP